MATIPRFIRGCNDNFGTALTENDVRRLRDIGVNALKLPVYGHHVGSDEIPSFAKPGSERFDFSLLNQRLELMLEHHIVPVVCPHRDETWSPGAILDDRNLDDARLFAGALAANVEKNFGPVIYGYYETELPGRYLNRYRDILYYHYLGSASFPSLYRKRLRSLYGTPGRMNEAYGTDYKDFSEVPIPVMGVAPCDAEPTVQTSAPGNVEHLQRCFPEDSVESRRYYDFRRITSELAAERYNELGELLKDISPGSEYWGPCIQIEYMLDGRQIHSESFLSPIGPTPEDLAKQPAIDCLHVDTYRETAFLSAVEYRLMAKIALSHGKPLMVSEVGGENGDKFIRSLDGLLCGAHNLRGAMIWDAKSGKPGHEGFGLLDEDGGKRELWWDQAREFFAVLAAGEEFYASYHRGDMEVYFPTHALNVVQGGNMSIKKTMQLMADMMEAGYTPEPILDEEVQDGDFHRLWLYSLYMPPETIRAIREKWAHDGSRNFVVLQYAGHSTGMNGPEEMIELWPEVWGFGVEPAGARPLEVVSMCGRYYCPSDLALAFPPFWDIEDAGTNEVVGRHSALYGRKPLAIRTPEGNLWADHYCCYREFWGKRQFLQLDDGPKVAVEPEPYPHRQSSHYAVNWRVEEGSVQLVLINLLRTGGPIEVILDLGGMGLVTNEGNEGPGALEPCGLTRS